MAGERPILIVDDDPALRAMLAEQLQVDGEFVGAAVPRRRTRPRRS